MRILLTAALLVAAAPAFAMPATPAQLEVESWQLFKAKRAQAFKALFAPNYVGLWADGTHDLLRDMQDINRVTLQDYRLSQMHSHAVDADDVLVTYAVDLHATASGKEHSGRLWVASLWHREHGRWLTVYHTEIKAKPAG